MDLRSRRSRRSSWPSTSRPDARSRSTTWQDAIDPEWRVYGRSSSDDKSPIVAFLAAIEALDDANIALTSNIRVIMEGEEEAGSPNLETAMRDHADRIRGDALLLVDGPRHASDRATLVFGARGIMNALITVYGPARDMHSGNYGNWAPESGAGARPAARVDEGRCRARDRSTASTTTWCR